MIRSRSRRRSRMCHLGEEGWRHMRCSKRELPQVIRMAVVIGRNIYLRDITQGQYKG